MSPAPTPLERPLAERRAVYPVRRRNRRTAYRPILSPTRFPFVHDVRQWTPPHTRASTTPSAMASKVAYVTCTPGAVGLVSTTVIPGASPTSSASTRAAAPAYVAWPAT